MTDDKIFMTDEKPKKERKKRELSQEQKDAFRERMRAGREEAKKKRSKQMKSKKVDVTMTETKSDVKPDTPVETTDDDNQTEINLEEPVKVEVKEDDVSNLDKELINLQLDIEELKGKKKRNNNTKKAVIIKKTNQTRKLDDDYIHSLVDKRIKSLVDQGNKTKADRLRKNQENLNKIHQEQSIAKKTLPPQPPPKPKVYNINGAKPWWDL